MCSWIELVCHSATIRGSYQATKRNVSTKPPRLPKATQINGSYQAKIKHISPRLSPPPKTAQISHTVVAIRPCEFSVCVCVYICVYVRACSCSILSFNCHNHHYHFWITKIIIYESPFTQRNDPGSVREKDHIDFGWPKRFLHWQRDVPREIYGHYLDKLPNAKTPFPIFGY